MPGAYRAPMTEPQWLNWEMAQTGIQSHATCQNVPALNTEANILAVQTNDTDPFWNYVPWQKTSARLGDEPEQWIPVVQAATGVDLEALNTVAEFRAACEGEGGVYVPADNPAFPANGAVTDAVAPLNAMIAQLTNRPLRVQLQAKRNTDKVVVMVTGPLNQPTTVTLRHRAGAGQQLGIARVLEHEDDGLRGAGRSARHARAERPRGERDREPRRLRSRRGPSRSGASMESVDASLRT